MPRRYDFIELPVELCQLILEVVKKESLRPQMLHITLGDRTEVYRMTESETFVYLGMVDLLEYSRKTIPFNRIPLEITNPWAFDISKLAMRKRLEVGW